MMIASKFTYAAKSIANASVRSFSNTTSSAVKVAVLGAAGGIGQPLSMLCKLSENIDELSTYDVRGTPGVAADLSHVSLVQFCSSVEILVAIPTHAQCKLNLYILRSFCEMHCNHTLPYTIHNLQSTCHVDSLQSEIDWKSSPPWFMATSLRRWPR